MARKGGKRGGSSAARSAAAKKGWETRRRGGAKSKPAATKRTAASKPRATPASKPTARRGTPKTTSARGRALTNQRRAADLVRASRGGKGPSAKAVRSVLTAQRARAFYAATGGGKKRSAVKPKSAAKVGRQIRAQGRAKATAARAKVAGRPRSRVVAKPAARPAGKRQVEKPINPPKGSLADTKMQQARGQLSVHKERQKVLNQKLKDINAKIKQAGPSAGGLRLEKLKIQDSLAQVRRDVASAKIRSKPAVQRLSGMGRAPATRLQKPVAFRDGTFNVNGRDASNAGSAARMYARQRAQEKQLALEPVAARGTRAAMRRAEQQVAQGTRIGMLPTTRRMARDAMSARLDRVAGILRRLNENYASGSKQRVAALNAASRNPTNKAAQRRAAQANAEQQRYKRSLTRLKMAASRYKGYLGG